MRHLLRRHPFPIAAFFQYSLVLTYALPASLLETLLPPRLEVDRQGEDGFVAIALVKTRRLRPAFLPTWMGRDFFLSGYRIFTRFPTRERRLRGLKILRSDTDSWLMTLGGNLMTHYGYHKVDLEEKWEGSRLELKVRSRDGQTDLKVVADASQDSLPESSPFSDWRLARKWAGPLPFTFSYEAETGKMVVVEGKRQNWEPRPIGIIECEAAFFRHGPFTGCQPRLANAFLLENIPYGWKRGRLL